VRISREEDVRRKLAALLLVALIPMSGAVACGQSIEDRARDEVDKQMEKGQKKLEDGAGKVQKQVEEGARKAQKQAEQVKQDAKEKAGGGQ